MLETNMLVTKNPSIVSVRACTHIGNLTAHADTFKFAPSNTSTFLRLSKAHIITNEKVLEEWQICCKQLRAVSVCVVFSVENVATNKARRTRKRTHGSEQVCMHTHAHQPASSKTNKQTNTRNSSMFAFVGRLYYYCAYPKFVREFIHNIYAAHRTCIH